MGDSRHLLSPEARSPATVSFFYLALYSCVGSPEDSFCTTLRTHAAASYSGILILKLFTHVLSDDLFHQFIN